MSRSLVRTKNKTLFRIFHKIPLLSVAFVTWVFAGCTTTRGVVATASVSQGSQTTLSPQQPPPPSQGGNLAFPATRERVLSPATPEAWALATTAILATYNKYHHDLLAGAERTAENVQRWEHTLVQWWNIHNRAELLEALQRLRQRGHRQAFHLLAAQWNAASSEQREQMRAAVSQDEQKAQQIAIVEKYAPKLGRKGLLGWDVIRYIMLCRWGYGRGYLTEQEAWRYIMPAARLLQGAFQSWADLGENYLIGRMFWSAADTRRNGQRYQEIYQTLLQDPASPWRQCPWNLSLGNPTSTAVATSK
jgi:hypothetical protein